MAAGVINLQKASGGVTKITSVDGVGITNLVVPESGTLATLESPVFTGNPTAKDLSYKNTSVTITSWSYSSTTITLNVTSHTFVAGDYIEVSGLTATTYPANGIFLVTSITPTTIVFTQAVAPTGTTGVSSATVKGYTTINGRVSESIGVNQTWKDVTASRSSGVTYTNTTGKPIFIKIDVDFVASVAQCFLTVDGLTGGNIVANNTRGSTSAILSKNSTYSLTGNVTINKWLELR